MRTRTYALAIQSRGTGINIRRLVSFTITIRYSSRGCQYHTYFSLTYAARVCHTRGTKIAKSSESKYHCTDPDALVYVLHPCASLASRAVKTPPHLHGPPSTNTSMLGKGSMLSLVYQGCIQRPLVPQYTEIRLLRDTFDGKLTARRECVTLLGRSVVDYMVFLSQISQYTPSHLFPPTQVRINRVQVHTALRIS